MAEPGRHSPGTPAPMPADGRLSPPADTDAAAATLTRAFKTWLPVQGPGRAVGSKKRRQRLERLQEIEAANSRLLAKMERICSSSSSAGGALVAPAPLYYTPLLAPPAPQLQPDRDGWRPLHLRPVAVSPVVSSSPLRSPIEKQHGRVATDPVQVMRLHVASPSPSCSFPGGKAGAASAYTRAPMPRVAPHGVFAHEGGGRAPSPTPRPETSPRPAASPRTGDGGRLPALQPHGSHAGGSGVWPAPPSPTTAPQSQRRQLQQQPQQQQQRQHAGTPDAPGSGRYGDGALDYYASGGSGSGGGLRHSSSSPGLSVLSHARPGTHGGSGRRPRSRGLTGSAGGSASMRVLPRFPGGARGRGGGAESPSEGQHGGGGAAAAGEPLEDEDTDGPPAPLAAPHYAPPHSSGWGGGGARSRGGAESARGGGDVSSRSYYTSTTTTSVLYDRHR